MLSRGITKTKVYIPHVSIEYYGDKNKMRTGEYCIRNITRLVEEGCISPERAKELEKWQKFRGEEPDLSGLSEKACRPLMREKDPAVKAIAIKKIEKALNLGKLVTGAQSERLIKNIEEGKDTRGRPVKTANDAESREETAGCGNIEPDIGTNVEQAFETGDEDFRDPEKDDVWGIADISDIPDMPDVNASGPGEEVDVEVEEGEKEKISYPEITAKVTTEFLSNAGHTNEVKPERIPSEEDKIALVEKFVRQMYEWGVGPAEIKRRIEKALIFASQS